MNRFANILAVAMLAAMLGLMVGSSWNDSATFDEVAHIGAGYTYLKYKDMRLNPEHPPLLKDLSALPLLFLNLKENITEQSFWTTENVNDRQWAAGNYLLYESGNNADKILFWSRFPMMILAIVFGWLLFWWVKRKYGHKIGLFTLSFFVTSPTFIAHSRLVTTDVGAALGFFLGIMFFLEFLERDDWKSVLKLGLAFGMVLMFKFSLILLLPTFIVLVVLWILPSLPKAQILQDHAQTDWASRAIPQRRDMRVLAKFGAFGKLIIIGLIALAIIWIVYVFHVWNYPQEQHIADAKLILGDYKFQTLAKADFWLIEHKITRPLGHYLFGFLMVARRAAGGNTAYFLGQVSSEGWWYYFPLLALLKEQLLFYAFSLIVIFWTFMQIIKSKKSLSIVAEWMRENFILASSIVFVLIYWTSSILNPLNIGVRHVLPTFPFIYFLVSREIVRWLYRPTIENPQTFWEWLKHVYEIYVKPAPKYLITSIFMIVMMFETLFSFPYYISYFNILGSGIDKGYNVATDSNYDWGQDLKRLVAWTEKENVSKIYLDYFGGGSPKYYLGDKFEPWWSARGVPPLAPTEASKPTYFAVSLNSLMGSQAHPIGDINIKPEDSYSWLKNKMPIARAGSSIFIFRIE